MNLTIRTRVGMGIAAVMLLGFLTGAFAYSGLNASSRGLDELTGPTEIVRSALIAKANLAEARRVESLWARFHDERRERQIDDLVDAAIRSAQFMGEVKTGVKDAAALRETVKRIEDLTKDWKKEFERLKGVAHDRGTTLVAAFRAASEQVSQALERGPYDDATRLAYLQARLAGIRYANFARMDPEAEDEDREKEAAKLAKLVSEVEDAGKRFLARVDAAKPSEAARAEIQTAFQAYLTTFRALREADEKIEPLERKIGRLDKELRDEIDLVVSEKNRDAEQTRDAIRERNAVTLSWVLWGSGANIVLAIVLGAFTIIALNRTLREVARGLDEGAVDLARAATSLASTSTRLADRAGQQASELEETSASIEELTATTRQNADSAGQAATLAQKARQAAESGNARMGELDKAMRDIQGSAGQIAKIIEVIKEIAFQTNLLALNAAVEAARAGEHGRGFAVVADEVRNLAQRVAASAKETSQLIGASVATAERGGEMVASVVLDQRGIVEDVQTVARLMEEIAAASREQAEGVHQINQAITTIDHLTQESSSAAETSAAAAEELAGQADAVSTLVASLVRLVEGECKRDTDLVAARTPASGRVAGEGRPSGTSGARPARRAANGASGAHPRPAGTPQVPSLTEEELRQF